MHRFAQGKKGLKYYSAWTAFAGLALTAVGAWGQAGQPSPKNGECKGNEEDPLVRDRFDPE